MHFHVMTAAQPCHCQRRCIVVVMRVDHDAILAMRDAADLTSAALKPTALDCGLHCPMRALNLGGGLLLLGHHSAPLLYVTYNALLTIKQQQRLSRRAVNG